MIRKICRLFQAARRFTASILPPSDPVARIEPLESRVLLSAAVLPRPDHVVIVVEEDHSYDEILGQPILPPGVALPVLPSPLLQTNYIRSLADNGASFTDAFSVGHHNAETYQAIFSGMTSKEALHPSPYTYQSANIASELIDAGLSFGGYSESLPSVGYTGGDTGDYKRGHNAWVDFTNVPASAKMPFTKFPSDYRKLPTVSYVVPNLHDSMHSGWPVTADRWLKDNLSDYAEWAMKHNSLLIVTWDESHTSNNQIPTIFFGPMVEPRKYAEHITQLNLLRTIEDMYNLTPTGQAADATSITDVFNRERPTDDDRHHRIAHASREKVQAPRLARPKDHLSNSHRRPALRTARDAASDR